MRWEDDEFDAELGDGDADATVPCPYCREPIHEDSQRCPHCGQYISKEDSPPARKAPWIVIGILVCLVTAAIWIIRG